MKVKYAMTVQALIFDGCLFSHIGEKNCIDKQAAECNDSVSRPGYLHIKTTGAPSACLIERLCTLYNTQIIIINVIYYVVIFVFID